MPWHKWIGEQSDGVEDHHGRLLTDRDDSDYHRRSFTAEAKFICDGGLRSGCDRSAIVMFGFTGYTPKYGNAWRANGCDGGLQSGRDRSAIVVFGFTGYTPK